MTRDPDLQQALDDARRELADRIRPRLVAGVDADAIADGFVTWLAGRGLHLIPQPPVVRQDRPGSRTPWRAVIAERPCHRTTTHHRHTWTADGQGLVCPGLPMTTHLEESR